MASVEVIYAKESLIPSFHKTLDTVAREKIYIEMTEAKPLKETEAFQKNLILKNLPVFYALTENEVVGWIDISQGSNPRTQHRGFLGMGLLKGYRGQGIGSQLLKRALEHAKKVGIEKVELCVFTENHPAINLYRKFGFQEIGVLRHYRKLEGKYFDTLEMEKFL